MPEVARHQLDETALKRLVQVSEKGHTIGSLKDQLDDDQRPGIRVVIQLQCRRRKGGTEPCRTIAPRSPEQRDPSFDSKRATSRGLPPAPAFRKKLRPPLPPGRSWHQNTTLTGGKEKPAPQDGARTLLPTGVPGRRSVRDRMGRRKAPIRGTWSCERRRPRQQLPATWTKK